MIYVFFVHFVEEILLNLGEELPPDDEEIIDVDMEDVESVFDEDSMIQETVQVSDELQSSLPCHLRCASHTLSLCATTDTFKTLKNNTDLYDIHQRTLKRCTAIWALLRSAKKQEELKKLLIGKSLLRPIAVRWNSLYNALCQLMDLRRKIPEISKKFKIKNTLRDCDIEYIGKYIQCLKPIADALHFLQGEKALYYGYLLPTLLSKRRALKLMETDKSLEDFAPLLAGLSTALETRFEAFFNVKKEGINAAIAAFSYQKFKYSWLHCFFEDQQNEIRDAIIDAAIQEAEHEEVPLDEKELESESDENFFDFGEAPSDTATITITSSVEKDPYIQVLRYEKDPRKDLSMLESYPIIKKMFLKYNTPLPSSAAVERLFSFATMLDLPRFNKMLDDFFETRVLGTANSRYQYKY